MTRDIVAICSSHYNKSALWFVKVIAMNYVRRNLMYESIAKCVNKESISSILFKNSNGHESRKFYVYNLFYAILDILDKYMKLKHFP